MIKKAYFISIWDEGYEHECECEVDTETREILDFGLDFYPDTEAYGYEKMDIEYIGIDGTDYDVKFGKNGKAYYC